MAGEGPARGGAGRGGGPGRGRRGALTRPVCPQEPEAAAAPRAATTCSGASRRSRGPSTRTWPKLTSSQLLNLITLETFLQQETRAAELLFFSGNKSAVRYAATALPAERWGTGLHEAHRNKGRPHSRGEYNVYSTFQSHEPEFDYLKSLEIEEKINKIRWLPQQNAAHFLLSTNDKTIKLWKISERDKRAEGYNLKDEDGRLRDPFRITALRVPILKPMDLMVEASPRRIFANAHTYHINSISVNSDHETYLSADDLRINLWHLEITDRSFNIVDIKPVNMEELTEVITAAEFHPHQCNVFVYSSSKGTIRLCDMRSSALCDRHAKFFEEPEDPSSRSFFSEIISSISDVKFSHSGRYMMTRDYLSVKVWDLNMESRPVETHQVHEYLRSKLCSLYENDCIFDKFECCWSGSDSAIMTGSYNNFFRMFDRNTRRDVTLEASRENSKPRASLKPRKVCTGGKRKKDEISVDSLDFNKKILHTAWHPAENIIAVAATNNLYIFQDKLN
uniref:Serine/threonine-protein phosphatase 2A 55 kDa regulatory subunit B n=2 Tax=Canis lupus TaxID=9612 RepID=A0A8C0PQK7_CANLF